MNKVAYKSFMVLYMVQCISAQLSSVEQRRNETHCDTGNVNIDCGSSVIAVDSIMYGYDATCDSICCDLNTDHCLESATTPDRSDVRRQCSGKSSCTIALGGVRAFCSLGTHEPSYVTIYYYCIPSERKLSVCSSGTLQSSSAPLYLTNKGYPGVTTGESTCSCSLEIYECPSSVNLYIIDADLYYDTSNCEQRLEIRDSLNVTLHGIECESYYGSDITTHALNKHYITINFLDNSTANQEGLFFLGFAATTVNTQFSLSCSAVPETLCVDCASVIDIDNGNASLIVENDSSYGARANVICEDGYNTTTLTIQCLDTGSWETSTCIADGNYGNGDSKEDLDTDTDESKQGGQDFAAWKIAVIVLSVAVVIALIVLIVVKCCTNSNRDQDTNSDREDLAYEGEQYPAIVPPPRGTEKESYLRSGAPLPAITPQQRITHGHVYIDHNDAHIFGLTIHIPFRKKNKLAPIDRHE
ncbi:uncharacterized protein LOC132750424 isoform X1 [Ruditapes philippinarum]|uniref:uncharacterized protein LOC132750424 isoform X1 n=1 Tax=Ruditapes philippinarum TaxID=129788 RepID=UPI00295A856D|nr:uncharacterized protein LOC132750424 isoform X1 [Ruditapes philippinarum]